MEGNGVVMGNVQNDNNRHEVNRGCHSVMVKDIAMIYGQIVMMMVAVLMVTEQVLTVVMLIIEYYSNWGCSNWGCHSNL